MSQVIPFPILSASQWARGEIAFFYLQGDCRLRDGSLLRRGAVLTCLIGGETILGETYILEIDGSLHIKRVFYDFSGRRRALILESLSPGVQDVRRTEDDVTFIGRVLNMYETRNNSLLQELAERGELSYIVHENSQFAHLLTLRYGHMLELDTTPRRELSVVEPQYGRAVDWLTSADGQLITVSANWMALTGQGVEELQSRGWIEMIHPDDRERAAREWQEVLETMGQYEVTYRYHTGHDTYTKARVEGYPVWLDDQIAWVGSSLFLIDEDR